MDHNMKQIVEEELKRGLEATNQLRSLLSQPHHVNDDDDEQNQKSSQYNNEKLLTDSGNYSNTIINSFDTSIAILQKLIQSLELKSSPNNASPLKTRMRTIETCDLTADGYIWRKYGRKSINNTKYRKDYYRCAYKEDQQCEAIKHVQKISDNPTKYRTTYYAQHICQSLLNKNIKNPCIDNLDSNEKDCTNFESKNPSTISQITQNPNHAHLALLNPSSSSSPNNNDNDGSPLLLTANHPPPNVIASNTTIELQPTLADSNGAYYYCNYSEQLMSPNCYMNSSILETTEDYSLLMLGNSFDMNDTLLKDLPLWD